MSRHHKNLTLGALNDTWDEIGKQNRILEKKITEAQISAINEAKRQSIIQIEKAKAETNRRLDKEIKELEGRTNRRLVDLDRKHSESLRVVTRGIYDDMNDRFERMEEWTQRNLESITENINHLQQDINRRFEDQQQRIESIEGSIQTIFDHIKNETVQARDVINEMITLLEVVRENNPVEKYTPSELREIKSHINDLLTRCGSDPSASIIAESRGVIRDILRMKEKALLEKAKHDELLFQTKARLTAILEVIGKNIVQSVKVGGEEEQLTATIATDFWTDDKYSKIHKRLQEIESKLANEEKNDNLNFDQITALLQEIEQLNKEGVALMQEAVEKAILSQARAESVGDIVNAMLGQGYILKSSNGEEDFDYIGGKEASDQREGVFAILQNPVTKDEISVILDTDKKLHIHMRNPNQSITEEHLKQSIERIRTQMKQSGYPIGEITAPEDGGNREIQEAHSGEDMRKKGAKEKMKEQQVI